MNQTASAVSRRTFVGGALGLAGASVLSGCGGNKASSSSDEVTFLNWEAVKGTPLEKAIRAWEKKSGTKVVVQPTPTADYDTKMRTLLAGGQPPDIMRINDDFVRGFSQRGALLDLNKYIRKDKLDTSAYAKESFEFPRQPNGQHTAWVLGYQPRLIFYNVDAFKEANAELPPTTWTMDGWKWDDFAERAKKLTVPGKRWGALVYYDTGYEQTFTINHGSNTGIFNDDGTKFTLAGPTETEALQWATDLTCKAKVQPPWSQLQQDGIGNQLFVQGKVAMYFATFGAVPYFRSTIKDFTWDVTPPPGDVQQRTESSVIVFTIPKAAKNPDKAWELLKFLASEEGGRILIEGGQFTPINNAAAAQLGAGGKAPEHLSLFGEAAKHLTAPNQTKNTLGARDLYRPALDDAYNCEKSVQDVLNGVKPQVEKALQG
ncbi:ABC transporter substrate-binding protein [Actinopolymorpha singaporensis]|uniref:ABC-type glycerol-3-phosphate transport system, substrate-binding protein n=1 Tax=Actinopolymorpha singaporensis TaxID=117157 RepID=A0A1H1UXD6_9ACTN|nr:sugar ABC transporter substrate-binding protein [Actinopolymorpha singaporensis]SDS76736.1 ABC-type glycerol-3-phosphate transport system, substrate-binding protein [Actinopolymorpha singaporensis]